MVLIPTRKKYPIFRLFDKLELENFELLKFFSLNIPFRFQRNLKMKKLKLIVFLCLFVSEGYLLSQPVYQGNLIFSSQEDIDSIATLYSGVTGSVTLRGNNIVSLGGMSGWTQVGNDLTIGLGSVSSLSGLSNITSIGGDLKIIGYSNSLVGLSGFQEIGGSLEIENTALLNLTGLNNLRKIGGRLNISNNALISLNGLSSLSVVENNIQITYNNALTGLGGLSNLDSVGLVLHGSTYGYHSIQIYSNASLIDVSGMTDLEYVEGQIAFNSNPSLTTITGFPNLAYANSILFHTNPALTHVSGFQNLQAVDDLMFIDNHNLLDISGFDNLQTISDLFGIRGHDVLTELNGFDNLQYAHRLNIQYNRVLRKINTITNPFTVAYYSFWHCEMPKVPDFYGRIDSQIVIRRNPFLEDLDNLHLLFPETGFVQILGNSSLKSIDALDSLKNVRKSFSITNNDSLITCCKILALGEKFDGAIGVYNNGPGCKTNEETIEICRVSQFHELPLKRNFRKKRLIITSEFDDSTAFKIAADGSSSTLFMIDKSDTIPNSGQLQNRILRIKQDQLQQNTSEFGSLSLIYSSPDSLIYSFRHPEVLYVDENELSKEVVLEVVDTVYNVTIRELPIDFYRAPVLMVHGLWASKTSFDEMAKTLSESGAYLESQLFQADYSKTNDVHFLENLTVVPEAIDNHLLNLTTKGKISAGSVDIVCHSMGGILSRLYLQSDLYEHDIHKLLTCNTPHAGAQSANFILDPRNILGLSACLLFGALGIKDCYSGAVEDLRVDSDATLNVLNNPSINLRSVPTHFLATHQSFDELLTTDGKVVKFVINPIFFLPRFLLSSLTERIYNDDFHDLIVADSSQRAGIFGSHISQYKDQSHVGSVGNDQLISRVIDLLNAPVSDQNLFRSNTYIPPVISYNSPFFTKNNVDSLTLNPNLNVTLSFPSNNNNLVFGDSISIQISSNNSVTHSVLIIQDIESFIYRAEKLGHSNSFTFNENLSSIGAHKVIGIGYDSLNHSYSYDVAYINFSTQIPISNIYANPKNLILNQGEAKYLGIFSSQNNQEFNICTLDSLNYSFKKGYASRLADGRVEGNTIGEDTLIVSYSSHRVEIPILINEACLIPEISMEDTILQSNNPLILDTQASSLSHMWSTGERTSSISVTDEGNYWVLAYDSTGCNTFKEIKVIDELANSLGKEYIYASLDLAPNPVDRWLEIDLGNLSYTSFTIQVIDLQGKIVDSIFYPMLNESHLKYNMEGLEAGLYIIYVLQERKKYYAKVLKN